MIFHPMLYFAKEVSVGGGKAWKGAPINAANGEDAVIVYIKQCMAPRDVELLRIDLRGMTGNVLFTLSADELRQKLESLS